MISAFQALLFLQLSVGAWAEPLKPPLGVTEPNRGILLVADHAMPDPRFQRTVILLLEHDDKRGTLGVVLNRPIDLTLDEIVPDSGFKDDARALRVRWGGPVAQNNLFMLFHADTQLDEARPISHDLYWSTSQATLTALERGGYDNSSLRLFIGAAGWVPGQLDDELSNGGWKLFALQTDVLFHGAGDDSDADALWHHFVDAPAQIMAAR